MIALDFIVWTGASGFEAVAPSVKNKQTCSFQVDAAKI
jgi:hypothetical protein